MIIGFMAFVMAAVAASGCNFIGPGRNGLFKYGSELGSYCERYSIKELGMLTSAARFAQAMGVFSATFGGIAWATCMFMLIFKFPLWLFKTIGGVYVFCFVSQMLTLLAIQECHEQYKDIGEDLCKLETDAITGIFAGIFYLGIGITMLVCPVPKTSVIASCHEYVQNGSDESGCNCCGKQHIQDADNRGSKNDESENSSDGNSNTSSAAEKYNADGTVTTKYKRTNPDGSKTVSYITRVAADV